MLQYLVKQHLSSVILTGAVAAISAYVLWGGDTKTFKRGRLRPALENLGNTCFLNCVTQALSSVESFTTWVNEILLALGNLNKENGGDLKKSAPMLTALYEVLSTLQLPTDGSQSTSLSKVHRAMSDHGWDTLFTQEDAYEAFQVLVTSVEREMGMLGAPKSSCSFASPVQGKFIISLECVECRTESSKRIEVFDNLTLHLAAASNINFMSVSFNSLRDMLTTYFSPETVSDVECDTCSAHWNLTTTCEFRRQVKIAKAPSCLCVQINRTEFTEGSMTKNNQHVSFPISSLDLTLFAYQFLNNDTENDIVEREPAASRPVDGYEVVRKYPLKQDDTPADPGLVEGLNYTLKSVIVHHGTANAGHYVTYRRLDSGAWLYASDDVVRIASREEVQRQQVYLLFYERETVTQVIEHSTSSRSEVLTPVSFKDDPLVGLMGNTEDTGEGEGPDVPDTSTESGGVPQEPDLMSMSIVTLHKEEAYEEDPSMTPTLTRDPSRVTPHALPSNHTPPLVLSDPEWDQMTPPLIVSEPTSPCQIAPEMMDSMFTELHPDM